MSHPGESEDRGALIGGSVLHGFLREDDTGEDGVEREGLVAENDSDCIQAFVKAVEELRGEVHLEDGVVDVGEAVGEEFHAACVLGDGEVPLFEVAILMIEEHVAGGAVGKEEIMDFLLEGVGGGGAADVVDERVGKGGVDPECDVGVQLEKVGAGVGW